MKRFISIQILIVVLLAITLVGSTFAWSTRPNVTGGYLQIPFKFTTEEGKGIPVNGNACTGKTYLGVTDIKGDLTYDSEGNAVYAETELQFGEAITVTNGQVLYFRTTITNGAKVKTNISLIAHIPTVAALDGKFNIGVSSPTKSLIAYPGEEFIPVVSQFEISDDTAQTTYIDWYIEFTAAGNFTLSNVYVANN